MDGQSMFDIDALLKFEQGEAPKCSSAAAADAAAASISR